MNTLANLDAIDGHVCILGSMNADYTMTTEQFPQPGETVIGGTLRVRPGGKSGNQAVAAALIGAHVKMFGAVGRDSNADFLLGKLAEAGVDVDHVLHANAPSGTALITVDAQGENTIVYSPGANNLVDAAYVAFEEEALTSASVLGLCLESPVETLAAAARLCHKAGMKVLLNISPFIGDLPDTLIRFSDILLANKLETINLLGMKEPAKGDWDAFDWDESARALRRFGFESAAITLGSEGSVVIDHDEVTRIAPASVEPRDTTGCGDAFMGTILAGLASGLSLVRSAKLASYVSAYAALSEGAQASYGSSAQVKKYFVEPEA